jgi:DNA-binding response OmpR family regulator
VESPGDRRRCRSPDSEGAILTKTFVPAVFDGAASRLRILVIEDDPSVGAAILMILDREGCDTVHVPDAGAGAEAFESSRFDLVIVDIFMPGVNGLEIIAGFRQQSPTVPILAMSGFRFRDTMDPGLDFLGMAAEAGAAACLRKPFAPRQLMAAVQASLDPALALRKPENQDKDGHDDAGHLSLNHPALRAPA